MKKFTEIEEQALLCALRDKQCLILVESIVEGTACIRRTCKHHVFYENKPRAGANAFRLWGCMLAVNRPYTQQEVSDIFGLTKESIRLITNKSLKRLKKGSIKNEMD